MSHRPLRLLNALFFIALLATGSVYAAQEDTRWYDVEVLLFMQKSQSYRDSEVWPLDYTLPELESARDVVDIAEARRDPANPVPFRKLDDQELRLTADAERIEKAPDMELLKHFGWRQPGMPQDQAIAVMVSIPADTEQSAEQPATTNGDALLMQAMGQPARLEGTLRLILSRYLHVEADLLYREPLPESAVAAKVRDDIAFGGSIGNANSPMNTTPAQQQDLFMLAEQASSLEQQPLYRVYRMQQSRRMRSGELHYLDHPVFGMALRVTPYEPPAQPEASPAQN